MTADTTKVAMNPAITPFIELDMAISQIGSAGIGTLESAAMELRPVVSGPYMLK